MPPSRLLILLAQEDPEESPATEIDLQGTVGATPSLMGADRCPERARSSDPFARKAITARSDTSF